MEPREIKGLLILGQKCRLPQKSDYWPTFEANCIQR